MGKRVVLVTRIALGILTAAMAVAFLVKETHPLVAAAGFGVYFVLTLFLPSILFRPKPIATTIGKGVFRYFVQVMVTADPIESADDGTPKRTTSTTQPTGPWLFREAGRKIRVFAALEIWSAAALLLWYIFGVGLAQLNQQIDHVTYTFLNVMVPVGLGFAISKGLTKPLRTKIKERIEDRQKQEPPRPEFKLPDATEEDLMPSGYPWNFTSYRPPKTSRELQTEFIAKMNDRTLSRFDRWTAGQFSLAELYGFGG